MVEKMLEAFIHPVKSKIFLEIVKGERMTAKELNLRLPDIPPATLYRYLGKMVEDGLLRVVEERKVRAVTEKVYSAMTDMDMGVSQMLEENRGDVYMSLFTQFALQLMKEFKEYTDREDINLLSDGSGFSTGPIYATPEELRELMLELGEVLTRFREKTKDPAPDRKHRSLAITITPPRETDEPGKEG